MGNINNSKFKVLLFCSILTFALMSLAFAMNGSSNAKKFYTNLLKDISERYKTVETSPLLDTEIGKMTIKAFESRKYSDTSEEDPMSSYIKELFTVGESKSEQTIIFDRALGKYYSKKQSDQDGVVEYLYDENRDLIYAKEKDGSIAYCKPTSNMLTDVDSFINRSTEETKVISFVLDKCIDNLKDNYFLERKDNGLNQYIISLDKNQMRDFLVNVYLDLAQDDDFKEYAIQTLGASAETWSEDANAAIEGVKERFDNLEEGKFELVFTLKGKNIKNLAGIKFLYKADDEEFIFELVGEKGKTLSKSKECSFKFSYNDNSAEGMVSFGDKKIIFEMSSITKSDTNFEENAVKLEIVTLDNKPFKKSSNIEMKLMASMNKSYKDYYADKTIETKSLNELGVSISTEDKKSFTDSKKIVVKVNTSERYESTDLENKVDSQDGYSLVIVGNDNKAILKSNEISISIAYEDSDDNDNKIVIRSKDNKEILKSTNVEIVFVDGTISKLAFVIKSNDKKPIKESTDVEFLDYMSSVEENEANKYTIKAYDKKKFKDSKDLEFTYTEAGKENPTVGVRVSILDKKSFLETGKMKVSGFVDGGHFEANIESKDKKSLLKTNEFKLSFNYESEDKKNYIDFTMDEKSFKAKMHSDSELLGIKYIQDYDVEYTALKESNIGKLIDINNAKEKSQKEVSEILGVYYYDSEAYMEELLKLMEGLN